MLFSFFLIFIVGFISGKIMKKLTLPPLVGYLLTGIILGPYALNYIDVKVLGISAELRKIALIIILIRAGINLNPDDLKRAGRPAILMCFMPATFEIIAVSYLGQHLFGVSLAEALVLGSVLAAVSPAVVVPYMLRLIDEKYGTKEVIPQMILAGASADDIYVIVLFTCFSSLAISGSFNGISLLRIPTSILLGIAGGFIAGKLLTVIFRKTEIDDIFKALIVLSSAFLLMAVEDYMSGVVGFSGLLATMTMGMVIRTEFFDVSRILSVKFGDLWKIAEILLFALVGSAVNIQYAAKAGIFSIILIAGALLFRMTGVFVSLIQTELNSKERLFCMIAYCPKATVQAAIGAIPLSYGLACGELVLSIAVISIIITAPTGAFLIEHTYKKCLKQEI